VVQTVAVIGLGKMGTPIAKRLIDAGFAVRGFTRSQEPRVQLERSGGKGASSSTDAILGADAVLTALPTEDAVLAVYDEIATAARPAQLFIDLSTVSPKVNSQCRNLVMDRGAVFLDAPVSGGPGGAESGTLTVMVGGELADFERARPIFDAFGKVVFLCGGPGAGQAVKLVNQLLVGIHTAAISEAAVLGMELGADPQVVLDVLASSFGSSAMMIRNMPRMIGRNFRPATPISLIVKDLGIIHREASRAGVPFVMGGVAESRFVDAVKDGLGDEDMAALVKLWEGAAKTVVASPLPPG
jgi:3-hydroxyisobutyrate dehydrogenase/2-hydroxy-3-oxopropionate reductase